MLKGLIRRIVGKKGRAMAKNERRHGKSARNGNAPSPYTKYKKRQYEYNMVEIDRNLAKARALGLHYVDYMAGRKPRERIEDVRKAA